MPSTEPDDVCHVAVGIIWQNQKVLISQRAEKSHLGGKWEFPGGKIHSDESVQTALIRELNEELGIHVRKDRPWLEIEHQYPDKHVHLHVREVLEFDGEAEGREGQAIKWASETELDDYEFPEADKPILSRIMLPDLYAITDLKNPTRETLLPRVERGLKDGLRLIQFRAPGMDTDVYKELAVDVLSLCNQYGARLILNAEPEEVMALGAHGVHLNVRRLRELDQRPVDEKTLVAVSCHNREEMELASKIGADFITLSPVLDTPSHPGAKTLGWEKFGELCEQASMPVYALGGMKLESLATARQALAQGIAMRSGIWRD